MLTTLLSCNKAIFDCRGLVSQLLHFSIAISAIKANVTKLSQNSHSYKGKRDYAVLHLLWSNALRRAEVVSINIEDWDGDRYLWIIGKGRTDKERITLNSYTAIALNNWLVARKTYID